MRVSEGNTVSHGPSCGNGWTIGKSYSAVRAGYLESQPRNGPIAGRFRQCASQRGTRPPKQSLDGAPSRVGMERVNPIHPPDKVFTSWLHLKPEICRNRLTIRIQK